ncbi:5'-3' exoribonuclease 2 [Tieghemiomyces parasiticus]|uniref:5'-3' exoribonuclease n=1 Tax=Tieghemiomyces parasiticus TaxID=78921 RepID=A0A9W8DVZ4_9FUNG|nr:5'-3' exoribonuclease 2 [Tieghemiomyces parasiticus]
MGIPAFYRWLALRYRKCIVPVAGIDVKGPDGEPIELDLTAPAPTGFTFDNLYLDMNGIIHPCCHPEGKPPPKNEEEMMEAIFAYIDYIFAIIRPRKLLYMAIDGVAPRAKMNQQRARRFMTSYESHENTLINPLQAEKAAAEGEEGKFDSNVITPGTPFMARLAEALRYYVAERLNSRPGWRGIQVILSDATVPGEGEHKIMEFIRTQRGCPGYNSKTRHVLYGLDADLIMLALVTHEPYFAVLREEQLFGPELRNRDPDLPPRYLLLFISALREYLEAELTSYPEPLPNFNLDRAIDDWIMLCYFVGNDFLPHLPALTIRDGSIDHLVQMWQDLFFRKGTYLTCDGEVDLEFLQEFLHYVSFQEPHALVRSFPLDLNQYAKEKYNKPRELMAVCNPNKDLPGFPLPAGSKEASEKAAQGASGEAIIVASGNVPLLHQYNEEKLKERRQGHQNTANVSDEPDVFLALSPEEQKALSHEWYYKTRFNVDANDREFLDAITKSYIEGLCWVLKYYYQGCCSWTWFYPYHYAPMACDFRDVAKMDIKFEKGKPFQPFEQLMGVFPPNSRACLPPAFANLLVDPASPILDFYPERFRLDINGADKSWKAVVLLPFINEARLLDALKEVYPTLTEEEQQRNSLGLPRLMAGPENVLYSELYDFYSRPPADQDERKALDGSTSGNRFGGISRDTDFIPETTVVAPFPPERGHPDVTNDQSMRVVYHLPPGPADGVYKSILFPDLKPPPAVLTQLDTAVIRGFSEKRRQNAPSNAFNEDEAARNWGLERNMRRTGANSIAPLPLPYTEYVKGTVPKPSAAAPYFRGGPPQAPANGQPPRSFPPPSSHHHAPRSQGPRNPRRDGPSAHGNRHHPYQPPSFGNRHPPPPANRYPPPQANRHPPPPSHHHANGPRQFPPPPHRGAGHSQPPPPGNGFDWRRVSAAPPRNDQDAYGRRLRRQ